MSLNTKESESISLIAHQDNEHFSTFRKELPQKLRLLSFAAKNEDFNEVGFIAYHIHALFDRFGMANEGIAVNRLSKVTTMDNSEAKREVDEFTSYWLRVVNS